ncbi:MAG TPA: 4-alpha-glucanotransferase [Candidatus Limnocylindrales bacterium]|nr:4-alpha-glucanotransferase [Candidatus Limnocylindrales bacterium]
MKNVPLPIARLCRATGVQRVYRDGTGAVRAPSLESLMAVLGELGAPLARPEDATAALRDLRERTARRVLPPVICATVGQALWVPLQAQRGGRRPCARLLLEGGDSIETGTEEGSAAFLPPERSRWILSAPPLTTPGYHRLEVDVGGAVHSALVLAAPATFPQPATKKWALFAPLYALHTSERDELATYGELAHLGRAARSAGADYVGTLPLLAGFLDEPLEPSPYSPLTRCFWNELYIDAQQAPELRHSEAARSLLESSEHRRACAAAVGGARIDYGAAMAARRRVLEHLAGALDAPANEMRRDAFERALSSDVELGRYAAFRAALQEHRSPWKSWPQALRDGRLDAADFARDGFRYHAYAQWLAREQIAAAAQSAHAGLYLDLPIGAHGDGYDTWRWRQGFAMDFSAGAPPDALFAGGQNWSFPPLHPQRVREQGYAPLRAALRHHCQHASVLRVDHVLGFHRLFWIPADAGAADGVYVSYRANELWSVLAIEAARTGTVVVGEDLGTVPGQVRRQIKQRRALRMYVLPFEGREEEDAPVWPPDGDCLACLGTHDTAPFAAWWESAGPWGERILAMIRRRIEEGSESAAGADLLEAQRLLLAWLGRSDAQIVLVNLEDLWLEREPQNRPGTATSSGNWQRRAALSLEQIARDPGVRLLLDTLERARRHARAASTTERGSSR